MENINDLRIIKTNKALFNALLELMRTKSFEEIKISDICQTALINRSTFYAHYDDKYDLLLALINNQKELLLDELKRNEKEVNTKEYFMELIKIIIEHVDVNRNVYSSILQSNKNGILIDILMDVTYKDVSERIKNSNIVSSSIIPSEFVSRFYLGAILTLGISWMNTNKYTEEQILLYLDKLIPEKIQ